jgi:AcrR family transcriptional regulator
VQLTRRRIIAAAMDLIERDGIQAVSMHRLATELGCGLVSLYSYVPSDSALLDGVADALMSGFKLPPVGARTWPEQIREQVRAFREMARARPRCTMVVVNRPPSSAGMLRPVERALATLREAGFCGQDAIRIIRAVIAYVMGSVLGEIGVAPGLDAHDTEKRPLCLRPCEFPHLTALATELAVSNPDADFEFGLELLMHSLAAMQPTRAAAS